MMRKERTEVNFYKFDVNNFATNEKPEEKLKNLRPEIDLKKE